MYTPTNIYDEFKKLDLIIHTAIVDFGICQVGGEKHEILTVTL